MKKILTIWLVQLNGLMLLQVSGCGKCDYVSIQDGYLKLDLLDSATGRSLYTVEDLILKQDPIATNDSIFRNVSCAFDHLC